MRHDHQTFEAPALTWALCIATLNRLDVLRQCVRLALAQTRPPSEIVIVDAGEGWERGAQEIAALVGPAGPPVRYLPSARRSTATQRNMALAAAAADIAFLIDDDSLMHPGCAAEIMRVYEADRGERIAAVAAARTMVNPAALDASLARRPAAAAGARPPVRQPAIARWLRRHLLLQTVENHFVPYRGPRWPTIRPGPLPAIDGIARVNLIDGYKLTVRRRVALAEPFDEALLAYAPCEDLDATHRYGRHGALVVATARPAPSLRGARQPAGAQDRGHAGRAQPRLPRAPKRRAAGAQDRGVLPPHAAHGAGRGDQGRRLATLGPAADARRADRRTWLSARVFARPREGAGRMVLTACKGAS